LLTGSGEVLVCYIQR